MKRSAVILLAVLASAAPIVSRSELAAPSNPSWEGRTMGSTFTVTLADSSLNSDDLERLKGDVDKLLDEINRQMSHYRSDSEISRFNASTSTAPFTVSSRFARVARVARELHDRSGGAFDPTLGPLINAWGFGPKGPRETAPDDREIRSAMDLCGGRHFTVTANNEIEKDIPQLQLNMSAVVAGYAADEVAALVRSRGVTNYFVNITTEIVVSGHNPDGRPWRVGLERPNSEAPQGEDLEAVLNVSRGAVSTSGDYRNYFEDEQGHRFCHILDPHTGRPIQHHLGSVTVVAADGITADGLATTLFVMGPEAGLTWLKQWPGAEALFIIRNPDGTYTEIASPGFESATGCKPR